MPPNLNPEAEDTRGGMLKGVDDIQAKPEDFDDDDEGEDDDDELGVSGGVAGGRDRRGATKRLTKHIHRTSKYTRKMSPPHSIGRAW